jgi:CBS domain-containing protein
MIRNISKKVLAQDIMTEKVVSVSPDTSIFDAARVLSEHNFDGLPVVDKDGELAGIVTEYDLITRTSTVNASFLQRILSEVHAKRSEAVRDALEYGVDKLSSMKVKDVMNKEPLVLGEDAKFEEIVEAFITHHRVNPIPIVNESNKMVGIVSRFDILRPLNLIGYGSRGK